VAGGAAAMGKDCGHRDMPFDFRDLI
jgi:hypothetical protein